MTRNELREKVLRHVRTCGEFATAPGFTGEYLVLNNVSGRTGATEVWTLSAIISGTRATVILGEWGNVFLAVDELIAQAGLRAIEAVFKEKTP